MNDKCIWILEDDKNCQFVYEQILDFRYKTRYFDKISEFREAIYDDDQEKPALVIADLMLVDGNFLNFLVEAKKLDMDAIQFIVVSSIDDIDALRFCFNEGALDYITKPFKKNELLIKIENVLSGRSYRAVSMEGDKKDVIIDGIKITNLTIKQIQVLSLFLKSASRSVKRMDILKSVWGTTVVHPKTIDVHLYNLRRKLYNHGYRIRSEGNGRWCLVMESGLRSADTV